MPCGIPVLAQDAHRLRRKGAVRTAAVGDDLAITDVEVTLLMRTMPTVTLLHRRLNAMSWLASPS